MALTHPTEQPGAAEAESVWAQAARCFEQWRGGDATALDGLVHCLTPVLWHVVRAYRLPEATAEDVIQSTWLALVRHANSIAEPAAIGAWLLTTARRAAWKAKSAEDRAVVVEDIQLAPALPTARDTAAIAVDELDAAALWARVQRLDERCQRLLRVVAFDDRPDYAHLAKDLGMPIGSIGPTRRRCLDKLRSALQEGSAS